MKKTLTVLIFLIPAISSGQAYVPMLGDSSGWYLVNEYFGLTSDYYFASQDTIIDSKNYKVLDGFHFNRNVFLREDTIQKRIYYRQTVNFKANQDILIYDFGLNVGDSMLLFNPNSSYPDSVGYFTLDSIASMKVLNGQRRVFHLSSKANSDHAMWIEGIGSTNLVNTASGIGDRQQNTELSCYFFNGIHVYQSDFSSNRGSCNITTLGIGDQDLERGKIGPNPTTGILNVKIPGNQGRVQVFDLHGNLLMDVEMNLARGQIDLSQLNPGMHLISIESEGREERHRVMLY